MELSSIMSSNLRDLQQVVSLSILNNAMSGQAQAAATMLQDAQAANPKPQSNHILDVYA